MGERCGRSLAYWVGIIVAYFIALVANRSGNFIIIDMFGRPHSLRRAQISCVLRFELVKIIAAYSLFICLGAADVADCFAPLCLLCFIHGHLTHVLCSARPYVFPV